MVVSALGFTDLEDPLFAADSGDPIGGSERERGSVQ